MWHKEGPGCYTNGLFRIERSVNGGWNVYRIQDGIVQGLLDNLPTKREATRVYG